jgi:hypothetical protein
MENLGLEKICAEVVSKYLAQSAFYDGGFGENQLWPWNTTPTLQIWLCYLILPTVRSHLKGSDFKSVEEAERL